MQRGDVLAVPDRLGDVEGAAAGTQIDATGDLGDGTGVAGSDSHTAVEGQGATEGRSATINRTTASGVDGRVGVATARVVENKTRKGVAGAGEV